MSHTHPHEEDRPEPDAEQPEADTPPWILRLRAITNSPVATPPPPCDPDTPTPREPWGCECHWSQWHKTQTQRAIEAAEREKRIAEGFKNDLDDRSYRQKHGLEPDRKTRIPRLKSHNVGAYIGAVAQAVSRGELDQASANRMLYAAQLAIASNKNNPTPTPTPPSRGKPATSKRGKK
jgi:hypothetical protein